MHYLNGHRPTSFVVQKFLSTYRWLFTISSLYEIILLLHTAAVCSLLGLQSYGILASCLSFVYVMEHVFDAGATNSLPLFFNLFFKSKKNFNYLLWRYTIAPQVILTVTVTIIAVTFFAYLLPEHFVTYGLILTVLMIIHGINAFLRQFLYMALKTKETASVEFGLLLMHVASLWSLYFIFQYPITISLYLYLSFIEAVICFLIFAYFMMQLYQTLPDGTRELPENLFLSLANNRWWSYVLRMSRVIFSSNFLTPLFAAHYGFASATIFSLAKKSAKVLQAGLKLCIGYSGNSLFATFKQNSLAEKQTIFYLLRDKIMRILFFVIISCMLGATMLQLFSHEHLAYAPVMFAILLITVTCFETLFTLYEQFYIAEEAAQILAALKVSELLVLYSIFKSGASTATELFAAVLVIRLISFSITAWYAFVRWGIAPLKFESFTHKVNH